MAETPSWRFEKFASPSGRPYPLGIDKLRAYVDNQLVVDQINGLSKVNSEYLKHFHKKVLALLEKFTDQRIYWVPRERNKDADALVRAKLYP